MSAVQVFARAIAALAGINPPLFKDTGGGLRIHPVFLVNIFQSCMPFSKDISPKTLGSELGNVHNILIIK